MAGVVVVTGGSRGIGAAVAIAAAAQGHAVCLNYLSNRSAADAVVAAIEGAGGRARSVSGDVAKESDIERLFDAASEMGPITGLVTAAGIPGRRSRLDEMDADDMRRVFATHVEGTFLACRTAVRRMATRHGGDGGAIVTVSSTAAVRGGRQLLPYVASKAAIEAFTVGLSREVGVDKIRVNAIRPGVIATTQQPLGDASWMKRMADEIPLGRLGEPEEAASVAVWLLSESASYVSGAVVDVHGAR